MPDFSIKITNLPQIKAAFERAPALMTRSLNQAIAKTLLTIKGDSMRNTPVLTGRLRASTYTMFSSLKGEVGTNTNYDIYVHNGTRYMRARPYLLDAVRQNASNTDKFFTDAVQEVLNDIGRQT